MKVKAPREIVAWFVGAVLLVALGVGVSFWTFRQIEEAAGVRTHTYAVINSADDWMTSMLDAETGMRGYLLTGDESFLGPYLTGKNNISQHLQELRQMTLFSAAQKHLDTVSPLMDDSLAHMSHAIELRRNHSQTAALALVSSGQGKRSMDSIRAEIASFIQLEKGLLAQREEEFQTSMRHLFTIIVTTSLLALLFALAFAYLIYRETQQGIKNLVHLETRHLLEIQEETNTQLKQANLTLRDSEEQLAVTLNSIGDAVIATDAEARVTRLNPVAEQLTGWTQAEASGRPVDEIFHIINQETRQPSTIPVMDTLAHGTVQGLANHTLLIARNGSERAIADSCAPIRNRDAQVVGAVLVFRDVSEEYAAQQALRDSAAQIQTILNTVVDGIINIHARGGIIETVNPSAEQMFGYTAAELSGKEFSLLIPELDRDQRNGSLEYYSASVEARAIGLGREVVGRRKDGSIFPLEIAVSEMWLGGQRYFTGILRDITARKQAEEALLKAGALQSAIFNSANFSSIATDAKGVIQIFNVGAERMLGYAATDVMNKITPADISDPQEVIARAKSLSVELDTPIAPGFEALVFKASRGIEDIYELTYIRKDGSRFPAIVSVTALRDDQDAIIGYLLIGTDNTARKQAEEALLKAGALQNAIFNSANFSSIATDAKGVIQIFNVGAERMLGYAAAEVMNKVTPADISDPQEVIARAKSLSVELDTPIAPGFEALVFKASRGIEDIYELTYIRKDGSRFPAVVSVTALRDAQDAIIGYLLIGTDNTARKQIEAERARLDQVLLDKNTELESAKFVAEKANLAKSDFLSSMSHELRTPLNAILGFAQLMESGSPPPTPAQRKNLDQILKAGWYLLELINEILDLALIESGKATLSHEPVSLVEVMLECRAMIEPQAHKRGIAMTFPRFELPYFVSADRTRVKQVLINLLFNAIKYNKPEGKVTVEYTLRPPDSIRISVRDTGTGLAPKQLAQLFQPFNRLGKEASTEEGTGIGLVVTKRLVELMGGTVGADSTVGVGSVFWFELGLTTAPLLAIREADHAALVRPQVPEGAPQRTLLYVEDNPANLELVEQLIARRPDLRLLSAADGNLGIEFARVYQPQVILMDINLPGISGLEAMKILRADPATAHIPIIALSANAVPRDIEKALEAGFFNYLTKPIKVSLFMDALDTALKISQPDTQTTEGLPTNAFEVGTSTLETEAGTSEEPA
ncbi:MAG: PAS domain S-box protein [Sterolibacterium sp.]|nr:PAS domain S-box protein [Sterolibacterium sp.]